MSDETCGMKEGPAVHQEKPKYAKTPSSKHVFHYTHFFVIGWSYTRDLCAFVMHSTCAELLMGRKLSLSLLFSEPALNQHFSDPQHNVTL